MPLIFTLMKPSSTTFHIFCFYGGWAAEAIMRSWKWVHFLFGLNSFLSREPLLMAGVWLCSLTWGLLTALTSGFSLSHLPVESPHHSILDIRDACLPRADQPSDTLSLVHFFLPVKSSILWHMEFQVDMSKFYAFLEKQTMS